MEKTRLCYDKILADYLKTGQETYLYQITQFAREMMRQGIGPEPLVEMHLKAVKKIN